MEYAIWPVEELRQEGNVLSGRFPYGKLATYGERGAGAEGTHRSAGLPLLRRVAGSRAAPAGRAFLRYALGAKTERFPSA